ncbi:MAG: 50S ribosomal protein L30 [Firmicutes bacterium]|uniref:Large ribosomal subunit protein uL30 n=1 Tax=Candidatus Gallilactobacillus intestinavium TaxID=2840838 RepID=A0A9D9E6S9_9LACO|nr:50S ribosomal protein L30 [Candidatus Gallilactobacillus intestinavium]
MADKVKITLIKSAVHQKPKVKNVAYSLGLKRVNSSVIRPNNDATRGAIFKIAHLVSVEEVK